MTSNQTIGEFARNGFHPTQADHLVVVMAWKEEGEPHGDWEDYSYFQILQATDTIYLGTFGGLKTLPDEILSKHWEAGKYTATALPLVSFYNHHISLMIVCD